MSPRRRGIVLTAVGALTISFAPILTKWAASDLGPTPIAWWRTTLACLPLFFLVVWRRERLALARSQWVLCVLAGLAFSFDLFVWHKSILLVGAGIATILANTQVFATSILGWFVFKERLFRGFVLCAGLGVFGVALLARVELPAADLGRHWQGIALGLATGVTYAAYIVLMRKTARFPRGSVAALLAIATASASIGLAVLGVLESERFMPQDQKTWVALAVLGFVVHVGGWLAITSGLPLLRTSESAFLLLLQPVLATLWGALFFGEALSPTQIFGGFIVLLAVYVGASRPKPP